MRVEYEQGEGEGDNWQVEKNGSFLVVGMGYMRGKDWAFQPVLGKVDDQGLSDHYWCQPLLSGTDSLV